MTVFIFTADYGKTCRAGGKLCRHAHSLFYVSMGTGFKRSCRILLLPTEAEKLHHYRKVRLHFRISFISPQESRSICFHPHGILPVIPTPCGSLVRMYPPPTSFATSPCQLVLVFSTAYRCRTCARDDGGDICIPAKIAASLNEIRQRSIGYDNS